MASQPPRPVPDTGLTVLYEPPDDEPVVADIVFVHGLQGHPQRTWSTKCKHTDRNAASPTPASSKRAAASKHNLPSWEHSSNRSSLQSVRRLFRRSRSDTLIPLDRDDGDMIEVKIEEISGVFWPKDLLPRYCHEARIFTWGYDTLVTRGWSATNKSNLFAHAKDLLYSIGRVRPQMRKLVFVAHSLGGILVKEVLRQSEISKESDIRNLIESTTAVMFLGTPHRGSSDLAGLGEVVRKVASTVLRFDSNASVLRTLGYDSPELEQCRASFTTQWREYDFRVKTFQEALPLGGINIGWYNDKVVPDISSLLDDPREHAETIRANHMDMVRFSSADDPGFQKVVGELRHMLHFSRQNRPRRLSEHRALHNCIEDNGTPFLDNSAHVPLDHARPFCVSPAHDAPPRGAPPRNPPPRDAPLRITPAYSLELSNDEKECLKSLSFPHLGARLDNIKSELEGTCRWLQEHPLYIDWDRRRKVDEHHGLLWVKGRPGAGKSTLMKKALRSTEERKTKAVLVASYFFNARGVELERTTLGLFRSLVHQILSQDPLIRKSFLPRYLYKHATHEAGWEWRLGELEDFLLSAFLKTSGCRFIIFVDALDECIESEVRRVVNYFRDLTDQAFAADAELNVCMSSRRYPTISIERCPEIDVEQGNRPDISKYVLQKMSSTVPPLPSELANQVDRKASHVFLWAVLVVEIILRAWDSGETISNIEEQLQIIPTEVEEVFSNLSRTLTVQERPEAVALFQWVILAKRPLTLQDVRYALFFSSPAPYRTFPNLENGEGSLSCERFARRILRLSRGMIEAVGRQGRIYDEMAKGSVDYRTFEDDSTVQVIHESVREWFMKGDGFPLLDRSLSSKSIGNSHLAVIQACINAMQCDDFKTVAGSALYPFSSHGERPEGRKFAQYVVEYVASHSHDAEADGLLPLQLIHSLTQENSSSWAVLSSQQVGDPWNRAPRQSPHQSQVLHFLCGSDLVLCARYLLEAGKDPNLRGDDFSYPIIPAIRKGHHDVVRLLIEWRARVDVHDFNGQSTLHYAVTASTSLGETVQLLLDNGSDIDARNPKGMTALMLAIDNAKSNIVKVLLCRGANAYLSDPSGHNALGQAVHKTFGQETSVKLLLSHGVPADEPDSGGETPLHFAARTKQMVNLQNMISASTVKDVKDSTQRTPLHEAARCYSSLDRHKMVSALLAGGCNPNCVDNLGQTPLHIAASWLTGSLYGSRHTELRMFQDFMEAGADASILDKKGKTAWDYAKAYGLRLDVLSLLEVKPP